ncbi:hypothetical protein TNCV_4821651 [Trichonephila clavipes]|nr:hypothetical protein TNCV_4821651 [Trichonephila clavipes]
MADCEVEGAIASPLSIPPERAMSPTGERSDEGRNIRTKQNPLGPQERQTRIGRAPAARITPTQGLLKQHVSLELTSLFSHVNVFYHDGKPVPIELSIATIPRDGSDQEVICITVNHAGVTYMAKDIRSNNYTNDLLYLVRPLSNSVPLE